MNVAMLIEIKCVKDERVTLRVKHPPEGSLRCGQVLTVVHVNHKKAPCAHQLTNILRGRVELLLLLNGQLLTLKLIVKAGDLHACRHHIGICALDRLF